MNPKNQPFKRRRPGIILWLYAFITRSTIVWLYGGAGGRVRPVATIATIDANGEISCPVFWYFNVGHCVLLPDKTVSRDSYSSYMKTWDFHSKVEA